MKYKRVIERLLPVIAIVPALPLFTGIVYLIHGKALTAGLIELVLVMLIAFRWGFVPAAVASILAVASLDYFYMAPIFSLYERDPQDWLSSGIFVTIALTAGHFADGIKRKAIQTESERTRLEKLYLTSRDVIMLDRRNAVGAQLTTLIADAFDLDAIALWDARDMRMDKAGCEAIPEDEVRGTYFNELHENDLASGKFKRVLRLGTRPVGSLYVAASSQECPLDPRSVDAIASLAAMALERAHSFAAESNAEAAKRSEQLRSSVLDGLAHAFKTPLATIQSASSGLLEINRLAPTETDLVSLIDEQATHLAKLTTQALRAAKLDEGHFEVDHESISLDQLLRSCAAETAHALAGHSLRIINDAHGAHVWADRQLLKMALLQMLDNAAKYASPSSPISFRAASTDTEVIFSVQNEGSFVAPEERSRIFERFYRSPGSQHKASGTGIGLSVTKRIADSHSGRVWLESYAAEGTTFFLALPRTGKES